ncbi:MAG: bifunctional (p)ppGpp synthetase/guanosine-3',5'-bis(diphosphate) 3'-pyrophosphohydrolase [Firmicutes bacterium]|nr:bifunctional (p)ppGpp synthetase/guanosine-3',5'-bis(diphosphate) 3'-pyrophosphohydrolase [Bacillota bacterium]
MAETIEQIIANVKKYNPASDSAKILAAYQLAASAHGNQKRDSGEPYIVHPLAVAEILSTMQIDDTTIIAGLLHDVVEDTTIPAEVIGQKFGKDAMDLVVGLTKLSKLQFNTRHDAQAENLRKMFVAMSNDIRIILIKLADRLHNMRTIESHHSQLRKIEIAEETLTIFAPLAHRLGIFKIKSELEDRAIAILEPEDIAKIKEELAEGQEERDKFIEEHCRLIRQAMEKASIQCEVNGRFKSYFSIYNKMRNQHKALSEIFDLNAIRVIVDTVNDCYGALGIIHTMWKPIPGRFKDFIAMPKANMYQSIHTTLIADNGAPFEVQIRTWDMHRTAEYGIAAHWRYKEGTSSVADFDKKIEWLRQMMDWQQDVGDANEFMENIKGSLFSENIYVFSPAGDVYELPAGSSSIDFAYRVHTQVGHQCVGAKINHRLMPLETQLKNGDIVEILTAKGSGPSRDWLKIVKTQQAKNKIRQWFRKEKRDDNIELGKEALDKECKKYNLDPAVILKADKLRDLVKRYNFTTLDDMYAALGDGALRAENVISRLKEDYRREQPPKVEIKPGMQPERQPIHPETVVVKGGGEGLMIHFASCCKPLPGDQIIGYITRGRGISIHRADCANVRRYRETEADRLIEVEWGSKQSGVYPVEMEALCMNRDRMLMDILAVMAETKTTITGVHVSVDQRTNMARCFIKMEVRNPDQFDYLMQRVTRIKDVLEVRRVVNPTGKQEKN